VSRIAECRSSSERIRPRVEGSLAIPFTRGARFITLEGPEGAGKSTQARQLAQSLVKQGRDVLLTREPGGTELGDRVRDLVLPDSGLPISRRAETLLYCVARAQLVEQVLRPALAAGRVVIVDRYADSTLAYQAYGRGLEPPGVRAVLDFATGGLKPDLTILLDLPVEVGLSRKRAQSAGGSVEDWNRFEAEDRAFHERVRQGYLELARQDPARWRVLDARLPAAALQDEIFRVVAAS
jgi:dTMP kinase